MSWENFLSLISPTDSVNEAANLTSPQRLFAFPDSGINSIRIGEAFPVVRRA